METTVLIRERARRQETEEQLARAESRYHELVDNLAVGVFRSTAGQRRRFLEANPALVEMLEASSKGELLQHALMELYAEPGKRHEHSEQLARAGFIKDQEVEMVTLKGRRFWASISARMKCDVEGTPFYDGFIEDVTQRKEAADALKRERVFMRTVLDNLPDVIYAKDAACRKVFANRADLAIMGCGTETEALGKTDFDFYSPEAAQGFFADDKSVLETGQSVVNRVEHFVDMRGRKRTLLTCKLPLRDELGRVAGLVGIGHDITDRAAAQEALRESQERLALVIEGSSDGVWDWDLRTNEVYYSPRWKSMLGYEDHEIRNHYSSWESLLHPEDREIALERIRTTFSGQTNHYELEHRLRHKDGSYRWILARGVLLRNAQGQPVRMAGSHVDLTARKQAMEQLQKANADLATNAQVLQRTLRKLEASNEQLKRAELQLVHSAKLETVGTLAAGIAHEVKNPLQVILMGLDYLDHKTGEGGEGALQVREDMRDAVNRANSIITEVLQLSAAREFSMAEEDLNRVIERAVRLVHGEVVASHSRLEVRLSPDLPPVPMDRRKMEQVLINLFLNALQAMCDGGVLSVATRTGEAGRDVDVMQHAFRRFVPGEPLIFLEVTDTGPGIPESNLPKIFDPFFTTKPVGVGTGLGLSIVRQIVDLHGGTIDVRNLKPKGLQATIILPCRRSEDPNQNTGATDSGGHSTLEATKKGAYGRAEA